MTPQPVVSGSPAEVRPVPMRVGYVLTHYPKLSQTFIANEIRELKRLGMTVVPFALNEPTAAELDSDESITERSRTVYLKAGGVSPIARVALRYLLRHPGRMARLISRSVRSTGWDCRGWLWRLFHFGEAMALREECRLRGVTHLHAQFGQATATVAWLASEIDRQAFDGSLTWSFTIHGFQDFVDERQTRLDLKATSAEFVVCVSDYTRAQLMRITNPLIWDRFHIVRCGIDVTRFTAATRSGHTDPYVVLTVGRLSAEKGHIVLLDALARLRNAGWDVVAELVGDGDFRGDIAAHAAHVGVASHVRFLGELSPEQVADRLRAADVFCLPSFAEGLPVSIMEAMAVGTPVVTTFISGIPELAIDRETALVVPAGNVEQLAHALASLMPDTPMRSTVIGHALKRVRANHDLHVNVAQLRDRLLAVGQAT